MEKPLRPTLECRHGWCRDGGASDQRVWVGSPLYGDKL